MRDHEPGAAEAQDSEPPNRRVDAALGHEGQERVLEVLAAVCLLVDILLKHRKVREREEDAGAGYGQLSRARQFDHPGDEEQRAGPETLEQALQRRATARLTSLCLLPDDGVRVVQFLSVEARTLNSSKLG